MGGLRAFLSHATANTHGNSKHGDVTVLARNNIEQTSLRVALELTEATSKTFNRLFSPGYQQYEAKKTIKGLGLTELNGGRGCYVLGVVEHPDLPGRVYKICHADPRVDPYIDFAQWIVDNEEVNRNQHFPRIYDIAYSGDGQIATVTMEKLNDFFDPEYDAQVDATPDSLENDYRMIHHNVVVKANSSRRNWVPEPLAAHRNPALRHACEMLYERFSPDSRLFFDLHRNNVMLRGNMVMVILDPIAPSYDGAY